MNNPSLNIIENEITRLEAISEERSLQYEEVKKLEALVKTRQLLLGEATSISGTAKTNKLSDSEVLEKLKLVKK